MIRKLFLLAAAGLVAAASLGAGNVRDRADGAATTPTFPRFTIVYDALLDHLDPALSYTGDGAQAMWRTYVGLLTYAEVAGARGTKVVPGLAQALPRISADQREYAFTLRKGLEYSDGTPIESSDFKYAIERLFRIESPSVGFFTDIVGASRFARTKKGDIPGIVVDDAAGTIRFELVRPRADFENILATIFAAPVPPGTPAIDQSTHPIAASGPYMITRYEPNRGFELARNPHFRPTPYVPSGNPDTIDVSIVQDDTIALQRVIDGKADYDDHQVVPVDRLASLQSKYGARLRVATAATTYYFFMNTRTPPFDKLAVRQAVNDAIDRNALVRLLGGLAAPTENVLPPTYPSYRKLWLYPYDLAKAKALIARSGASGARVTVWGFSGPLGQRPVAYLTDQLDKIGLKATLKIVNPAIYFTAIGNQATKAQIGVAGWTQDYPHPLDWFDVLLNGERITRVHNNNYSNANVPAINARIDRLKLEPTLTPKVNAEWAAVDRMAMRDALWAPFANPSFADFFSARVDLRCYLDHVLYRVDWYRLCVR